MNDNIKSLMSRYENEGITELETVIMFQNLVSSGHIWTLSDEYIKTAKALIEEGIITAEVTNG